MSAKKESAELPSSPMLKPGRNLISLIGRVDFCLKTQKMYPEINAIWNVYGGSELKYIQNQITIYILNRMINIAKFGKLNH